VFTPHLTPDKDTETLIYKDGVWFYQMPGMPEALPVPPDKLPPPPETHASPKPLKPEQSPPEELNPKTNANLSPDQRTIPISKPPKPSKPKFKYDKVQPYKKYVPSGSSEGDSDLDQLMQNAHLNKMEMAVVKLDSLGYAPDRIGELLKIKTSRVNAALDVAWIKMYYVES
jgi:hypothetical protein